MKTKTIDRHTAEDKRLQRSQQESRYRELVDEIRQHDLSRGTGLPHNAFEKLINTLSEWTKTIVSYKCPTSSDADRDDIVQEISIRLCQRLATYDTEQSFSNWYFTLCRNHCVDWVRNTSRRSSLIVSYGTLTLSGDTDDDSISHAGHYRSRLPGPIEYCYYQDFREVVEKSIEQMCINRPDYEQVLRLRSISEPLKSIAFQTGFTLLEVKSIIRRWRKRLKKMMGG